MPIRKFSSIIALLGCLFGQTTGKISGRVTDKITSESLPGTNIYLEQTSYGTASDVDGRFTIINIPPGKYTLKVDMIGYKSVHLEANYLPWKIIISEIGPFRR